MIQDCVFPLVLAPHSCFGNEIIKKKKKLKLLGFSREGSGVTCKSQDSADDSAKLHNQLHLLGLLLDLTLPLGYNITCIFNFDNVHHWLKFHCYHGNRKCYKNRKYDVPSNFSTKS